MFSHAAVRIEQTNRTKPNQIPIPAGDLAHSSSRCEGTSVLATLHSEEMPGAAVSINSTWYPHYSLLPAHMGLLRPQKPAVILQKRSWASRDGPVNLLSILSTSGHSSLTISTVDYIQAFWQIAGISMDSALWLFPKEIIYHSNKHHPEQV